MTLTSIFSNYTLSFSLCIYTVALKQPLSRAHHHCGNMKYCTCPFLCVRPLPAWRRCMNNVKNGSNSKWRLETEPQCPIRHRRKMTLAACVTLDTTRVHGPGGVSFKSFSENLTRENKVTTRAAVEVQGSLCCYFFGTHCCNWQDFQRWAWGLLSPSPSLCDPLFPVLQQVQAGIRYWTHTSSSSTFTPSF